MKIRTTIIFYTVPLFMLLACVNGALLYVQDRAEMARALDAQAMAAAVTTAQFLSARSDADILTQEDKKRLSGAAANITGLNRVIFKRDNAPDINLIGSSRNSGHYVSASTPAGPGASVVAHIDATPMDRQLAALKTRIALLIFGAGCIGAILGWFLGGRISREFNHVITLTDHFFDEKAEASRTKLTIRETIDLSGAVQLMRASMRAALSRQSKQMAFVEDNRNESNSVLSYRDSCFPPIMSEISGTVIAIRMLGNAPAGCFYAIAENGQEAAVIIGECSGNTPALALANALAARSYFERNMLHAPTENIVETGRRAFSIAEINRVSWSMASPPAQQIIALLKDNDTRRAHAYHALNPALSPDKMLEDLAALLKPHGVIAVLGGELDAAGRAGEALNQPSHCREPAL
ncbi:hypothetical protein AB1K62_13970 [Parasphingorhabdus sp. JC815]|uniref:hypothetical protein n=1 Tax=Parasphingorhabdus sp. JC815 TaxID=3232140 RepID=UPI00345AAB23